MLKINKSDTTRVYGIYLEGVVFTIYYMFRLFSLGHRQVVSIYRGNYIIYGMIQYVNIEVIMILIIMIIIILMFAYCNSIYCIVLH